MRNRLEKRPVGKTSTSNVLRLHKRSRSLQSNRVPLPTQSSCCAKSQHPIHTTWVGSSTQILRLRFAARRMTGERGAPYAMVANNAL